MIYSLTVLFVVLCLGVYGPTLVVGKKDVMVWLCLDICDQGGINATKNLAELSNHLDVVSGISFEKYTLGPNATLVTFDITEVSLLSSSFIPFHMTILPLLHLVI